jgi:RNA polymerase II elongation factor ELL
MKVLPLPGGQRKGVAAAKLGNAAKFLAGTGRPSDTTRSMPSSPNLSGVGSPSLGPTSAPLSQQQAEQAKATRKPVVHLLALSPMTETELKIKIPDASNNDIKQWLQKVGELNANSGKWELRKNFYKELDVYTFKYGREDRQRAIDNAIRQYDRMRLGVSEPEWDRLLPKEERGTGKCLSKLQAQIAQGTVAKAPKINVQKAEESGRDTPVGGEDEDEDVFGDKKLSKLKGESMTRSVSQPPTTKSKKVGEKEAQAKRLLSKNPPKPKAKPAPSKKEKSAQKESTKFLSSQFVGDSDEEDDYMPVPKTDAKAKPSTSTKRSREEDAETSDSGIPLGKKVKKDTSNHRISDASQSSRTTTTTTYSSSSSKTKGNSPQKSSPLASSPPTNASEFENSSGHTSSSASPAPHSSIKVSRSPIHKRHQKSSSVASSASSTTSNRSLKPEVIDLARRYRSFYPKYEALHKEVASLGMGGRRDSEKEQKLLDMHERLSLMKKDILAGIVEAH